MEPPDFSGNHYQLGGNRNLGKLVMKPFDDEIYLGKVVGWLEATAEDEALFHVLYEDNDEEDLNQSELSEYMNLYAATVATERLQSRRVAGLTSLESKWIAKERLAQPKSKHCAESPMKKIALLRNETASAPKNMSVVRMTEMETQGIGMGDVCSKHARQKRSAMPRDQPAVTEIQRHEDVDTKDVAMDHTRNSLIKILRSFASYFSDELFLDEIEGQILDCVSVSRLGMILEWFGEELTGSKCLKAALWARSGIEWKDWRGKCLKISKPEQVRLFSN
jgi:hypothetical protein